MEAREHKDVECREVIISRLSTRGKGTEYSPIRRLTQVFYKDGKLIAEHDPTPDTFNRRDLIHFAEWFSKNECLVGTNDDTMVNNWLDSIKNKP